MKLLALIIRLFITAIIEIRKLIGLKVGVLQYVIILGKTNNHKRKTIKGEM